MGVATLCTKQISGTQQGAPSSSKRSTSVGCGAFDISDPGTYNVSSGPATGQ